MLCAHMTKLLTKTGNNFKISFGKLTNPSNFGTSWLLNSTDIKLKNLGFDIAPKKYNTEVIQIVMLYKLHIYWRNIDYSEIFIVEVISITKDCSIFHAYKLPIIYWQILRSFYIQIKCQKFITMFIRFDTYVEREGILY